MVNNLICILLEAINKRNAVKTKIRYISNEFCSINASSLVVFFPIVIVGPIIVFLVVVSLRTFGGGCVLIVVVLGSSGGCVLIVVVLGSSGGTVLIVVVLVSFDVVVLIVENMSVKSKLVLVILSPKMYP